MLCVPGVCLELQKKERASLPPARCGRGPWGSPAPRAGPGGWGHASTSTWGAQPLLPKERSQGVITVTLPGLCGCLPAPSPRCGVGSTGRGQGLERGAVGSRWAAAAGAPGPLSPAPLLLPPPSTECSAPQPRGGSGRVLQSFCGSAASSWAEGRGAGQPSLQQGGRGSV